MDLGLKGKTAIITGSSRGIGKGIALSLASEGCNVAVCARTAAHLNETAAELRQFDVGVLTLQLDVTHPTTAGRLADLTLTEFGRIDILVNNAGANRRKPFENVTDRDWEDLIALNLVSHVRISRQVIPHMKKQGGGAIIFVASIFGRESGGPGNSVYNSTKSGVISLAKVMAVELAPDNIRVNSVAPGAIRFPGGGWDKRCKEDPQGMAEFVRKELPLGRFGRVDEVANVVTFLASERASLITGACINVDGGQSRSLI